MRMLEQHKHVIHSLDILCLQLETVSFMLSPSIWTYLTRCTSQAVLVRVREIDPEKPLAWWMLMVLCFNAGSLYHHAAYDATDGTAFMLDFIGMSYRPSRLELLLLDTAIVFLQVMLVVIVFEASVAQDKGDDATSSSPSEEDLLETSDSPTYVLDITLKQVRAHLWTAPPISRPVRDGMRLPLPIATRLPVSRALNAIIRNRREQQGPARPSSATVPGAFDRPAVPVSESS